MDRINRKIDHINHALDVGGLDRHGFDDLRFVHQSLPGSRLSDRHITTYLGGHRLCSPLFINGMTGGGGKQTEQINRQLAEAAAESGIGMAVGSQMSALKDPAQIRTYRVIRDVNPSGVIFANIGSEATVNQAKQAVDMIDADGLQIHLNVIQELVMPEGDRDFTCSLQRIEEIVTKLDVPVVVKEVGFGMSYEAARQLSDVGVTTVDVGGWGGTNFAKIENIRRTRLLAYFNDWGIQTSASVAEIAHRLHEINIVASGGLKNGLDVAKALALGASAVGFAGHFLKTVYTGGVKALVEEIANIHDDLRLIMTAVGARTIEDLTKAPIVISGETAHYLSQRGVDTTAFAQRSLN